MKVADYVNEIVVPTMIELRDAPRDRRRAYLACVTVFHVKDHVAAAMKAAGRPPGRGRIERVMEQCCGDAFRVVQAVCNATKHVATAPAHGLPFRIGSDWDRPPALADDLECDVSELGDDVGGRSVERYPGFGMDLYFAARMTLISFLYCFPTETEGASLIGLPEVPPLTTS